MGFADVDHVQAVEMIFDGNARTHDTHPTGNPQRGHPEQSKGLRGMFARALAFLLVVFFITARAHAHNTDTSYARVRIFGDHLEVRLTLDIFTLQRVVPDIDASRDAALSREELRRATPAIQKFLRSHVGMEVDEAAADLGAAKDPFWPLDAPDPIPAGAWHTNEALISFGFDKPLASPPKTVALLFDVFGALGERHSVLGVFEYRGQITEVVFTLAEPDYLFDVAYAAQPTPPPVAKTPPPPPEVAPVSPARAAPRRSNADDSPVWRFFKLGVGHILTGYDHLCFLLALLVVSRLKPLIAIVTSFTIAHSITLLLAAFEVVKLPSRFIECSIALTIVYVGVENICRTKFTHRWMLTFFFGLIHGFGFANTLNPQELPAQAKAKCLVVFNLGVEAAQIAVVFVLLPLALALAKWKHGRRAKMAISVVVALLGLAWFLDRVLGLGWMPF
jgi:hydrogenase/urease accessory protein HupE